MTNLSISNFQRWVPSGGDADNDAFRDICGNGLSLWQDNRLQRVSDTVKYLCEPFSLASHEEELMCQILSKIRNVAAVSIEPEANGPRRAGCHW
jgi:hypothetical protein